MDIREMSFQTVLDTILKPAGVKVGGFPPEIFRDLKEKEKEDWTCNICYLIVNECRQCDNKHLFCNTCVFAWSMTYNENSQKCPMCRCDQKTYSENKEVTKFLHDKRVNCPEESCTFKSPLKIFMMHSHGKQRYSNAHVDLESLRPERPQGTRLLVLPSLGLAGIGAARTQRGTMIRTQLQQGRMMINQMMMLLHLEMQLRQQAVVSYQEASSPGVRGQRLDEVLALNEQLNEVGTILSVLLNTPLNSSTGSGLSASVDRSESPMRASSVVRSVTPVSSLPSARVRDIVQSLNANDDEEDDDDDDDSDSDSTSSSASSVVISTARLNFLRNRESELTSNSSQTNVLNRSPVTRLGSTLYAGQAAIDQARQRREISQGLLRNNDNADEEAIQSRPAIPTATNRASENTQRSTQGTGTLLNRRQDESRQVSTPRISESGSIATMTSTTQQLPSGNQSSAPRMSSQTSNTASSTLALPSLEGLTSGMRSTTQAISAMNVPTTPDNRENDTPTPTQTPEPTIPVGSSTLRRVMESMDRNRTPVAAGNRAPSRAASRLSINENPIQTGSSQARLSSSAARTTQTRTEWSSGTSTGYVSHDRSSSSQPYNDQSTSAQEVTAESSYDTTASNRGSSILPASLYRRRPRPESSTAPAQENTNPSSTEQNGTNTKSRGPTQARQGTRSQPVGVNKASVSNRSQPVKKTYTNPVRPQNTSSRTSNPSSNRSQTLARQVSTQSSTTDSGISSGSSETSSRLSSASARRGSRATAASVRGQTTGTQGLPTTAGGLLRARRRSEIHQQMLMRK